MYVQGVSMCGPNWYAMLYYNILVLHAISGLDHLKLLAHETTHPRHHHPVLVLATLHTIVRSLITLNESAARVRSDA